MGVTKHHTDDGGSHNYGRSASKKSSYKRNVLIEDEENRPSNDDTLSTKSSSSFSEICRKNHSICRDVWDSPTSKADTSDPTRFRDEQIVFSSLTSMDRELCWLDDANIGLYLLHDCDDPWDNEGPSRESSVRCGESIKRLLNASWFCMSLVQLGDLKWRASSASHQHGSGPPRKDHNHKLSYSILN